MNGGFTDEILGAECVSMDFRVRRRGVFRAVSDVSVALRRGETIGIVGGSGSGKTTLARILAGILAPTRGRVLFHGKDVSGLNAAERMEFRSSVQIVFQDTLGALNPRMRACDVLQEVLRVHKRAEYPTDEARRRRVGELLDMSGLPSSVYWKFPHEMSGGQRQRLGVARALACDPEVLLADEPVSALDVSVQAQMICLFSELTGNGKMSLVLIAHDLAVVRSLCARVLVMRNGCVVEEGDPAELFAHPLNVYTKELLEAVPDVGRSLKRRFGGAAVEAIS